MPKNKGNSTRVDYEAYSDVPMPAQLVYMHNVLATFVHAIPSECRQYCTSVKHPKIDARMLDGPDETYLWDYVEQRLGELADYEYRSWINGQQPFVTPRELQLWRLKIYVQHIWFWNLPDDNDLAMIFNLTKRRAANLASDFIARFRKTFIYPVALRRLYALVNTTEPVLAKIDHPKASADGNVYKIPSSRLVNAAQYLVEDLRNELKTVPMVNPYLYDRDQGRIWIDTVTVDAMKTNDRLRLKFYDMYKIPKD